MPNELPLKIRIDIRDLWNSPQSPLQQTIKGVAATLGHKITPQVQWPLLWGHLKGSYEDPSGFIPAIVTYASTWYEQLTWRLENDAYAEWTEQLLSVLEKAGGSEILLHIEAQGSPNTGDLHTHWKDAVRSFYLLVPHGTPKPSALSSSLAGEFQKLFDTGGAESRDTKVSIDEDGWADVEEPEHRPIPSPGPRGPLLKVEDQIKVPRKLPTMTSLVRPSELFQSNPPYILIVDTGNPIFVQCSHQKALELLSQYLTKWGKPNRNDTEKRNVLEVDLIESDFAVGVIDSLRIEPRIAYGRTGPINPAFVLAFVEGILGYKLVHTTGVRFVYRSDDVFN